MKQLEIAREIEAMTFEMWAIKSLAFCNETAILKGDYDVSGFAGSLHILTSSLRDLHNKMENLQDKLFDEVKSDETN